jgi:hypothetical protein
VAVAASDYIRTQKVSLKIPLSFLFLFSTDAKRVQVREYVSVERRGVTHSWDLGLKVMRGEQSVISED